MLMNMLLPKFDIYQGIVAPNCFQSYTNSLDLLIFFSKKKKVLSDVRSEIHLSPHNIVFTRKSVPA